MYIHPFMAGLALVVAGLTGAAIAFIWANAGIGRSSKVEHTMLALAYAASLLIFIFGMFRGRGEAPWAVPVAVMIMGLGTAWANWRAGDRFWLVFGAMTFLGSLSMLVMELFISTLSLSLFLILNIPWMLLMVCLVYMIIRRTSKQIAARRRS